MNLNSALPNPAGKPTPSPGGVIADFDDTTAAPEYRLLPPGVYTARVVRGEYTTAKKSGADMYRLKFEVMDGPHAGETVSRFFFFSTKAIAYTKRDLMPFGLTTSAKLLAPFPDPCREYRVRLVVAVQTDDDGSERNDIKRIDLLEVADSPAAAYTLPPLAEGGDE